MPLFSRLAFVVCLLALATPGVIAADDEPIAYIGHGGFFDHNGSQIAVTPEWVAATQEWYRKKLLSALAPAQKTEFASFEKKLNTAVKAEGQARLVVQQRSLDWLAAHSKQIDIRTVGKLNALAYSLKWKLPQGLEKEPPAVREEFRLDPNLMDVLKNFTPGTIQVLSATTNTGQAYINECSAAGVPIPPTIGVLDPNGTAGWKSQGFIPTADQFIVGSPAEVRTYKSTSPAGMCIALPRYTDASLSTVGLDGVICLGQTSSKVCFWDNEMMNNPFSFTSGTHIPIGIPNLAINAAGLYQAGGAEIPSGGGICTDCHAGENPYIIHPNSNLGAGVLMGSLNGPPQNLPTFAVNRYDPLVVASWPQNALSMSPALVPSQCLGCHVQGGAGRFPHLSSDIPSYCGTILANAITRTMPPSAPGSLASDTGVVTFRNWCNTAPSAGPTNRGDPHLVTTNGTPYDFQAGGEFTALRNSDTRFELQTRQTPITTSFVPGANDYTGLQSCVSLNSAAALRLGKHRVTLQGSVNNERVQLRIDGKPVTLPATGFDLGGGNLITGTSAGGIDVRADDGTLVQITPQHWLQEGYWYLDINVLNTPAREGTMGTILPGNFLPLAPNGSSFGTRPGDVSARYDLLYHHFADAWRVTNANSLFDYAPGTSTADFTDRNWPPEPGKACTAKIGILKPPQPIPAERAQKLCSVIKDKAVFKNCVFDTIVMGDEGVVQAYQRALKARGKTLLPLAAP
ncbi:MAG TPA: hypothetical protein VF381_02320 [Thermoanaerobaculia bacterium]